MAEKYTLNWQTFIDHLQSMLKDLYEEREHSDVTLVCDDQTQFKAHKIVLRACSPVFKKIIDNNPSQHPLIQGMKKVAAPAATLPARKQAFMFLADRI